MAGASAGRRTVSRLHRREALGLGGNARSRTAGCGGVRRSCYRAGRGLPERALGRGGLLGATGLASLQFGSRAGREGALRLAASLA